MYIIRKKTNKQTKKKNEKHNKTKQKKNKKTTIPEKDPRGPEGIPDHITLALCLLFHPFLEAMPPVVYRPSYSCLASSPLF